MKINKVTLVSKFLSVKKNNSADNLTMRHICPLRRKKSLEVYGFKVCYSKGFPLLYITNTRK